MLSSPVYLSAEWIIGANKPIAFISRQRLVGTHRPSQQGGKTSFESEAPEFGPSTVS